MLRGFLQWLFGPSVSRLQGERDAANTRAEVYARQYNDLVRRYERAHDREVEVLKICANVGFKQAWGFNPFPEVAGGQMIPMADEANRKMQEVPESDEYDQKIEDYLKREHARFGAEYTEGDEEEFVMPDGVAALD